MNKKEIHLNKLIFNFLQYYEMENSKLFDEYCNYCIEFSGKYNNEPRYKPTDILTWSIEFNDKI